MKNVLCHWKKVGTTPFQMVCKIKSNPLYENSKVGFAGRLDPMASGVMLFLLGDENSNRKHYERFNKTYEFEVLFGISSDTYDVMGIPTIHDKKEIDESKLAIPTGKFMQPYPPYSYKKVKGKALYWWARNNMLHDVNVPTKQIEIYSSTLLQKSQISLNTAIELIKQKIMATRGDFRQQEIIEAWEEIYRENDKLKLNIAKFEVNCSSGTYIRSLANQMGQNMGTGAMAYSITRTRIGKYSKINCETEI